MSIIQNLADEQYIIRTKYYNQEMDVEQFIKADHNASHGICSEEANPAPYYGGLIPPFYSHNGYDSQFAIQHRTHPSGRK